MKLIDLKNIMCVTYKKKVVIYSQTISIDSLCYDCWQSFFEDETNNGLILADMPYSILVNQNEVSIWVA